MKAKEKKERVSGRAWDVCGGMAVPEVQIQCEIHRIETLRDSFWRELRRTETMHGSFR